MNKCSELTAALGAAKLKHETTSAELVRVQRMAGITEENQRQEIAALTDRCVRLANMNESETALRRQLEDRAARCDLAEAELQRLRKEVRLITVRCVDFALYCDQLGGAQPALLV